MQNNWICVDDRCEFPTRAMLNEIRSELDRLYWNKNQKEMVSPFDNTGAKEFKTNVFTVRCYDWDENILPNFETNDIKIWWYKHSNRGLCVKIKDGEKIEKVLFDTLNACVESLKEHFNEESD